MKYILKSNTFIFFLIVLAHLAYKSLYLDYWGFWHDEAFSLYFSQQHWGHIKHISEWDINPPLYYYFLWIWQNLFGNGEYAIRFSSVIFSALAAGMLYVFSARYFNRFTGWVAVLLFSTCNEMYFYAHEARPYAMILFFTLCSSYFFLQLISKPGWLPAIALGILDFGLIYTHYVSGIIIGMQVIVTLLYFNKQRAKWLGVSLGATLLLAFLRFTKKTITLIFHNKTSSFWIKKPTVMDLKLAFYDFFNGADLFYIFLIVAIISLIYMVRQRTWKQEWQANGAKLTYLFLCGAGAILICFLISLRMPLFVKRYILFTGPFLYVLLGYFISKIPRNVIYPLAAILAVFLLFSTMRIDWRTPKSMDYRGALHLIKALRKENTPVLVETRDVAALFSYYYDKNLFTDYGNMENRMREKGIYPIANTEDVKAVDLAKSGKVILTQTFEELNPDDQALQQYLNTQFSQRQVIRFYPGITINVLTR